MWKWQNSENNMGCVETCSQKCYRLLCKLSYFYRFTSSVGVGGACGFSTTKKRDRKRHRTEVSTVCTVWTCWVVTVSLWRISAGKEKKGIKRDTQHTGFHSNTDCCLFLKLNGNKQWTATVNFHLISINKTNKLTSSSFINFDLIKIFEISQF